MPPAFFGAGPLGVFIDYCLSSILAPPEKDGNLMLHILERKFGPESWYCFD